jgi:hypothetical protein
LRDIDLGIAVGSAAKTAALHSVDCCCQTRAAVAARKHGIIRADHAVALSLSVTHNAIAFDRRIPDIDFDTLDYTDTGTLPVAADSGTRHDCARHRQQPRRPSHPPERPSLGPSWGPHGHCRSLADCKSAGHRPCCKSGAGQQGPGF